MAAMADEVTTGHKRGPGRPSRGAMPAAKKQKTAAFTPTRDSSVAPSPVANSPAPEKKLSGLVAKLSDARPLPVLPDPQPLSLSDDEYQSLISSAVLATSLERSRLRWISEGVFERYWVKPEGGKNGKPPPPNNPDAKWMKSRGECRIRIEPHLFVADMYVEDRGKPPGAASKQPIPQYRPMQQHGSQQYQNRPLPPVLLPPNSGQNGPGAPPKSQQPQRPQQPGPRAPHASSSASASSSIPPQGPKPDPVISMLATRASNDPQLKALMKEVATGNATQDQLKVFQKHIDELTAIITKQRQDEEDSTAKPFEQGNMIQYDGPSDTQPSIASQATLQQPLKPPIHPAAQHPPPQYGQQQTWSAPLPAPTNLPVILAFKDAGATEDRFLFPEHSILEALSPQHLLVSFIVTRKGHQAVDTTYVDLNTEYWQPVTIMIEVAYGREELLNCIRRWVKPADEVRKHMESVMRSCERVPECHLALRLPFKSTATAESEEVSKEATPVLEDRARPKAGAKAAKKAASAAKGEADAARRQSGNQLAESITVQPKSGSKVQVPGTMPDKPALHNATATDQADGAAEGEGGGRPRRATRKSVRISEG
ncbi:hypothetical protein CKM354_000368000 [Cercospora kikuchii]|uniref:SWR1-complex protein 3 domain-containing protein n=1 Tax=Cercospora kikuchii TaxID=84275 RepID=A0A9P3FAJ1_9PEZI|nr:uncharacterized protein CKM354_000368000 [Cercospora kikuchii]GIZ40336.1 hypothetical protein CKM354_000368000 [Cercospora kikuchii]